MGLLGKTKQDTQAGELVGTTNPLKALVEALRGAKAADRELLKAALREEPVAVRAELSDDERGALGARWNALQGRRATERPVLDKMFRDAEQRRDQAAEDARGAFTRLLAFDSDLGVEVDSIYAAGESGRPAWLDELVAGLEREAAAVEADTHAVRTRPGTSVPPTIFSNAESLGRWRAGLRSIAEQVRARVVRCELVTREDALAYVEEQRKSLPVVETARGVAALIMKRVEDSAEAAKGRA